MVAEFTESHETANMPDLAEIELLAADYSDRSIAMSGMTYALLLSSFTWWSQLWRWDNAGQEPTDVNIDRIQEIVDQAMVELMQNQRVGEIICYAGATPTNVLPCDGATYVGADYPELFALIDAAFISGDDFTVPDLRSRGVIGTGQGVSLTQRNIGATGGNEAVALTTNEMPAHVHGLNAVITTSVAGSFIPYLDIVSGIGGTTNSAGNGAAHENMHPFLALNFGIVAR